MFCIDNKAMYYTYTKPYNFLVYEYSYFAFILYSIFNYIHRLYCFQSPSSDFTKVLYLISSIPYYIYPSTITV